MLHAYNGTTQRLIITAPPRHGKAVSDITLVDTVNGKKRHGDLVPGDYVFSPSGQPISVVAVGQAVDMEFRVRFTDHSWVDVHGDHEWVVYDRSSRRFKTLTTRHLSRLRHDGRARFQLPQHGALQYPVASLPFDPYFLGAWLGDGCGCQASMCGAEVDLDQIAAQLPPASWSTYHKTTGVKYIGWRGVKVDLQRMGVLNNKHIPEAYLTSSEAQRRRLLAGLVDTDGSVEQGTQRVRFVNCNERLIHDVATLVRSLGYRATVNKQEPHSNGQGINGTQIAYTVQWTPHDGQGGGTLPRKRITRTRKRRAIGIASVEPCDPVPGRCIQVDAPDGLYLVGHTLIATHNSTMFSKWLPAWWLGVRPEDRVMLASYESELATSWGRKARDILEAYGPQLFGVTVSERSSAANRWDIDKHDGGMVTVGVGGALTGRGANLLIVDDYCRNSEDARSETMREKNWDWWTGTALTRLEPGGVAVVMATRWHEDDLIGRIMANDYDGDWKIVALPAIALHDEEYRREGEALWPERFDVPTLQKIRQAVTPYWFNAEYMCSPTGEEGDIFKKHGERYWRPARAIDTVRKREFDAYLLHQANGEDIPVKQETCWRFVTVDLAASEKEHADYTVYQAWAITPKGDMILLDMIRRHIPGPEKLSLLQTFIERWQASYVAIEHAGFQLDFIQRARYEGMSVMELKPKGDKVARAIEASIKWEAGQVYLPQNASWLDTLRNELFTFPNGAHDDIVDAMAYAAIEATKRGFAPEHAYGLYRCENCNNLYTVNARLGLDRPCTKCGTRPDNRALDIVPLIVGDDETAA